MDYSSFLDTPEAEDWQLGLGDVRTHIDPFRAGLPNFNSGTWSTFISLQPNAPPGSTTPAQGFHLPLNKDPVPPNTPKYDGFFADPATLPKEAPERVIRKVSLNVGSETDFEQEGNAQNARGRSTCSQSKSTSVTRARRDTQVGKNRRQDDGGGRKCSNGKCKLRRSKGRQSERRSRSRKHRSPSRR